MKKAFRLVIIFALVFAVSGTAGFAQDDYDIDFDFEIPEVEKNPFDYGLSVELKPSALDLNREAAAYRLKYANSGKSSVTAQFNMRIQIDGSYKKGDGKIAFRTNTDLDNRFSDWTHKSDLYEGYYSWTPDPTFTVDAGKKVVRWGKGYAWNPVAFIDRPKDPEDPELALEGYSLVSADYIKSYYSSLQTLAVTLIVLPAAGDMNPDFEEPGHVNYAGKLYALWRDTDIDVMYMGGGSRADRLGMDFSRNLKANLEVHGEWARVSSDTAVYVDDQGNRMTRDRTPNSVLLGLRYLDENDITYIAEYYRNGFGISRDEMRDYFSYAEAALQSGNSADIRDAKSLSDTIYGGRNVMNRYAYFKLSWKEPRDILYFTPGFITIYNIEDRSYSLTPEFIYSPATNLTMRLRLSFLRGGAGAEFGEKANSNKIEFSWKRYF